MKPLATPFEAWEFEPEEFAVAASFSPEQTRHIQTELSAHAAKKVALAFDPSAGENAQLRFLLESEYERGACEALASLLNTSDDVKSDIAAFLEKQKLLQQDAKPKPPQ